MKKQLFLVVMAGGMMLTSCKPTSKVTQDSGLIVYEEQLDKIDKNTSYVNIELSDNISINAEITPYSEYGTELGIYEFQRQVMNFEEEKILNDINECRQESNVSAEEVIISVGTDSSLVGYGDLSEEQMKYYSLASALLLFEVPLNVDKTNQCPEGTIVQKKCSEYFAQLNDMEIYGIETEEEYEEVVAQLTMYGGQNIIENIAPGFQNIESDQFTGFYVAECLETVGDSNIPLKGLLCSVYKNYKLKDIPETCSMGYDDEVFCGIYNCVLAVFDTDKELQSLHMEKNVQVEEKPVRYETVVDVCSVIDYFYQKMKTSQSTIIISDIELFYTGIVVEEEGELEDYIWPVWKVTYYKPGVGNCADMYINAVTGKEL